MYLLGATEKKGTGSILNCQPFVVCGQKVSLYRVPWRTRVRASHSRSGSANSAGNVKSSIGLKSENLRFPIGFCISNLAIPPRKALARLNVETGPITKSHNESAYKSPKIVPGPRIQFNPENALSGMCSSEQTKNTNLDSLELIVSDLAKFSYIEIGKKYLPP